MPGEGFHIADAYVEIHADKSALNREIADLPRDSGPAADRAGQDIGGKVTEGAGKKIRASKGARTKDVESSLSGTGGAGDRAGQDGGGKLAQGFRMSFLRNSPLIVAAVAGALIAGGPAMLTAATGLFAGIGILAAAQSN